MIKIPALLLGGLEAGINRALRLDPATLVRLAPLAGKVIAVELRGINATLYMAPHTGGLHLLPDFSAKPDAVISGAPLALARLAVDRQDRRALFEGDIVISGDMDLGREFQELLQDIDIDWEEQLAKVMGDVLAHQVGNVVRQTTAWGRKSVESLRQDVAEYLQEEAAVVPRRDELEKFLSAVDDLRSDVDRLEARLKRLQSRTARE